MVPLVTSQRALCQDMLSHKQSSREPGAVGNFVKGNFFFFLHAEPFFFFFLNRWSRDISVLSRLGSTSTCFFVSSERFAPSRGSSLCCRSYASLPLTAVCGSELSAFTPTISEWTTRTCATRGWCLAGRSWQKSSSGVHPYAPTHSTRRECRLIFLLGGRGGGVGSRSEDKDGIFEGNRWN